MNLAQRRKIPAQTLIRRVCALRKDEPDAIVLRRFFAFPQNHQQAVTAVHSETGK